jgi:hypothetical protein
LFIDAFFPEFREQVEDWHRVYELAKLRDKMIKVWSGLKDEPVNAILKPGGASGLKDLETTYKAARSSFDALSTLLNVPGIPAEWQELSVTIAESLAQSIGQFIEDNRSNEEKIDADIIDDLVGRVPSLAASLDGRRDPRQIGETLDACLPLPRVILESLGPLIDTADDADAGWKEALNEADADGGRSVLESLREPVGAVDRVMANALTRLVHRGGLERLLRDLEAARSILGRLGDWTLGPSTTDDRYTALNRYLEHRTLERVGRQQLRILKTLRRQHAGGWLQPKEPEVGGHSPLFFRNKLWFPDDFGQLVKDIEEWQTEGDRAQSTLGSIDDQKRVSLPIRVFINWNEVETLNRVSRYLIVDGDGRPADKLGTLIAEAIRRELPMEFHRLRAPGTELARIGEHGWSTPLIEDLEALHDGVGTWDNAMKEKWPTGEKRIHILQTQQKDIKAFVRRALRIEMNKKAVEQGLIETLMGHLQLLSAAMVEIGQLFTPARWAYDPMSIEFDQEVGAMSYVGPKGSHFSEELFRNVAEMNTLLLALFLLRAPQRSDNPFKLLILDDPLQNMDELPYLRSAGDCAACCVFGGTTQP